MQMKKYIALLILLVLIISGCASDKKKPSDDSHSAVEAYDHIIAVKEAYEIKNIFIIKHLVPELSEHIIKELSFEKAELSFEKRLVRITKTSIIVNLNWQGLWWIEKDRKIENRGVADFVLNRETMILSRIDGDNPFLLPEHRK